MPESVSSNRNNQVISNLINGDLRLYGRYDNKEFGASVEVYNNAYVEYIAIVEGKTSMVPANKAKHITAVLDLEPEYIEDENNLIEIKGTDLVLENTSYKLFPELKGKVKLEESEFDNLDILNADFELKDEEQNTDLLAGELDFAYGIDKDLPVSFKYEKADIEENDLNSFEAKLTVKDFWNKTDLLNSTVNINAKNFSSNMIYGGNLNYLSTIENYDLDSKLELGNRTKQLYLYGRTNIQPNRAIYSIFSKVLVGCTSNTEFKATIKVDDYIREILSDLEVEPEYQDTDLMDCVVHMHDYKINEIDGIVDLDRVDTLKQFDGVVDIIIPVNKDIESTVVVPIIVSNKDIDIIDGSLSFGERQVSDLYSVIHVLNDRYIKPEPTDEFLIVDTIEDLMDLPKDMLIPGMKVFVKSLKKEYRLNGSRKGNKNNG